MKKGFVLGLATGVVLTGASLVLANSQIQAILNDQIKVTLDGQIQEFKDETTNETQYPITYKNRTYLPLRTVANLVGVDVDYDASSNIAILKTKDYIETKDNSYIFPTSSTAEITADLSNMSLDELELAKNEIFARYGYDFSVKTFADYFATKAWYKKVDGKKVSVSELNAVEQKNVAYIDKYINNKQNIKKKDSSKELVYMIKLNKVDNNGNTVQYPQINLDYRNIDELNQKIKDSVENSDFPTENLFYINENIISIVLKSFSSNDYVDMTVYNVDANTGKQLTNDEIINTKNITADSINERLNKYANDMLEDWYKNGVHPDGINLEELITETKKLNNLSTIKVFLNKSGSISLVVHFYSVAGGTAPYTEIIDF